MSYLFIKLIIIFPLIGYLRYTINNNSPNYLINLSETNASWLKKDSLKSRFTPIFNLLVVIYNYIAWTIYGLASLFELVGYILSLIWEFVKFIILWIWNEVLNPTLFSVVKLCWHYLVIFSWKLFQFAFSFIIPSHFKSNILYSFKQVLKLSSTLSVIWIIYSLLNSKIILYIGCVGLIFLLQFLIFKSASFFRSNSYKEEWIKPSLKLTAFWLLIASIASIVLLLLNQYSNNIVISGLSLPLTQILLPISFILFFAFIFSFNFLPAYTFKADGKIKIEDFLKNIVYRLPKLIFSQPFYILGSAITLIIPLIISFLLLQSAESVSKNNSKIWQRNIFQLPEVSLEISANNDRVDNYKDELNKLDDTLNNTLADIEKIAENNMEISEAKELKSLLIDNSIFTFEDDAFVGETQRFSVNTIESCTQYKWEIMDPDDNNKVLLAKDGKPINNYSSAYEFYHQWQYPGSYKIAFSPSNNCGVGQQISRIIYVNKRPRPKLFMDKPTGSNSVCQGDTALYTASSTMDFGAYEWKIPNNATYFSGKKGKKITIIWGDTPGTVRVKGLKFDSAGHIINQSIWSGILVNVAPSVGGRHFSVNKIPDEIIEIEPIKRPFLFYTLEEANNHIRNLKKDLSNIKDNKLNIVSSIKLSKEKINSKIETINDASAKNRSQIIGTVLAMFGFVILFSITFSTLWTYQISFYFDLYNFEQPKNHYWKILINDLKSRNSNQPLLGWFVVGGLILLNSMIIKLNLFSIF